MTRPSSIYIIDIDLFQITNSWQLDFIDEVLVVLTTLKQSCITKTVLWIHLNLFQANITSPTMTTTNSKGNSAAAKNFITVATKTHDGGAKANNTSEPAKKRTRMPVRDHEDPFLYYSHQETKMHALLLRNDSNDENDEQVDQERESVVRKTRMSFELHPALLLEDLLPIDVAEAEVQRVDTSSGDVLVDELRRLFFCVDHYDTEI